MSRLLAVTGHDERVSARAEFPFAEIDVESVGEIVEIVCFFHVTSLLQEIAVVKFIRR